MTSPSITLSLRKKLVLLCAVGTALFASPTSAVPIRFDYTGAFVSYVVGATGTYHIVAYGAQGGAIPNGSPAGLGAAIGGDVLLNAGAILTIAVGQMGFGPTAGSRDGAGGGGGGTFVVMGGVPVMIAGGGGGGGVGAGGDRQGQAGQSGGAGGVGIYPEEGFMGPGGTNGSGGAASNAPYSAAGGGGFFSDGGDNLDSQAVGGAAFLNGLAGGAGTNGGGAGGFGGGGGASTFYAGAGGGGYSGGGGGGSFNGGLFNDDRLLASGFNVGNGFATIELLAVNGVPEPESLALLGVGFMGIVSVRRVRKQRGG